MCTPCIVFLTIAIEPRFVAGFLRIDRRGRHVFILRLADIFVGLPQVLGLSFVRVLIGFVLRIHLQPPYSVTRNPLATLLTPSIFIARSLIFLRSSSVCTVPVTLTSPLVTMK